MNLLSDLLLLLGSFFMFLAAVGIIRMPDVYTRLQAGTKAATLGAIAVILSVLFTHPEWGGKLVLILFFVLLTSPVGSSTIARSAFLLGQKPWKSSTEEEPS
jgi:multicomponent Na+:H+ antiporter subunit G